MSSHDMDQSAFNMFRRSQTIGCPVTLFTVHQLQQNLFPTKNKKVVSNQLPPMLEGRDSSVGIANRYGLDGPRIKSRWQASFSAPVQTSPGAHPTSYTMSTGSFPGVKRPGRGVDHPPSIERLG